MSVSGRVIACTADHHTSPLPSTVPQVLRQLLDGHASSRGGGEEERNGDQELQQRKWSRERSRERSRGRGQEGEVKGEVKGERSIERSVERSREVTRALASFVRVGSQGLSTLTWKKATHPLRYTASISVSPRAFSLYTLRKAYTSSQGEPSCATVAAAVCVARRQPRRTWRASWGCS